MTATVRTEAFGPGVTLVTLDRPERLNAMNVGLIDDLHAVIDDLAADESCRVVVLTGEGRGFCSGLDIKDLDQSLGGEGPAAQLRSQKRIASLIPKLRALPQPVIAAVNGPANGGGFALALGCDIRIASTAARFNVAFVRIGLSGCDIGVSWLLPRLIGAARAWELMLTGRMIDADEAVALGLVLRAVPGDELLADASAVAQQIVANSPFGVTMTKEVMWTALEIGSLQGGIDMENPDPGADRVQRGHEGSGGGVPGPPAPALHRSLSERDVTTRTKTQMLADFASQTTFDDLPVEVVEYTKLVILDSLICGIAARGEGRTRMMHDVVRRLGGPPDAAVFGLPGRVASANAAMANAEIMNLLDADDTFYNSSHFAAMSVAAAFSEGQRSGASGEDVIRAVALGFDVSARLNLAILVLKEEDGQARWAPIQGMGFATFGAAAAAAAVTGLSLEQTRNAFGLAAWLAPTPKPYDMATRTEFGTMKYVNNASVAAAGVLAATYAEAGYLADQNVLDVDPGVHPIAGAGRCRPRPAGRGAGRAVVDPRQRRQVLPGLPLRLRTYRCHRRRDAGRAATGGDHRAGRDRAQPMGVRH